MVGGDRDFGKDKKIRKIITKTVIKIISFFLFFTDEIILF